MKNNSKIYILLAVFVIFLIIKGIGWYQLSNNTTTNEYAYRNTANLVLTKHVRCRMGCRDITVEEIKEIIEKGKVNYSKSGLGSRGDSTFALEGYSNQMQHIRVIVAPANDGLVVITCIDLDKEWPCNCN
ncbi:MAG: DUF4258 domain-containing protein [Ginsengibacter sp.]